MKNKHTWVLFLCILFAIQNVSAIIVISKDYPSNFLGTGMATSSSDSEFSISVRDLRLENRILVFGIDLKAKDSEKADVYVDYSLLKEEGQIFTKLETKTLEDNLSYEIRTDGIELDDGLYTLRVSVIYGRLQRLFVGQRFKVENGNITMVYNLLDSKLFIGAIIAIPSLGLIFLIVLFIKKLEYSYKRKLYKVKHMVKKNVLIPVSVNVLDSWHSRKHHIE